MSLIPRWKKIAFVAVLCTFICCSVLFTFYSIAWDTFELEEQTNVGEIEGLNGWVFFGFKGNTSTKSISIDFVRDKKRNNPDESNPIVGVDAFTIVSDEYIEYLLMCRPYLLFWDYTDEKHTKIMEVLKERAEKASAGDNRYADSAGEETVGVAGDAAPVL